MKACAFGLCIVASALASPAALADIRLSGAIDAAYQGAESDGQNASGVSAGGSALVTFDPGVNLQVSGGGAHSSGAGLSADSWMADADAFWRDRKGAIGASVGHGSVDLYGLSAGVTGYGIFGEWYANRWLTLRFNGGGFSGDAKGWYGSGGAEVYLYKMAAVYAEYDYIKPSSYLSKLNEANVGAEYMLSEVIPLSLRLGFSHTWTRGADANGLTFALHYRFGGDGTLADRDRSGAVAWNGLPSLMRAW